LIFASSIRSRRSSIATLKRACCAFALANAALLAAPAAAQSPSAATVPTQLPDVAKPSHYAISLTPDAAKMRFDATVRIDLEILKPTRTLTLNALDLRIASAGIVGGAKAKVALNADAQTATLTFPADLKPGKLSLDLAYSGIINTQANGLFALDYTDNAGKAARALFTQFEAADARRLVPSWDEPAYKATFDLTALIPKGQMAVGNMPVASRKPAGNGREAISFQRSPKMSTYLLFFALGDLERITAKAGDVEIGVVTSKGQASKGGYALEAGQKIIPYYNDYFGVPYPLPKLDNVAGPGRSQFFGAMENWGAIFTFEYYLLNDPKLTTPSQFQDIFRVTAHESAHQWFGDLVTMRWWDDLWLNEGFASWMETKAMAHFNPDWQIDLDHVKGREKAMDLDAMETTHPVIQKIATIDEINQAFDVISYQKGEAVITMLESFAGEDVWRSGLRLYMKRHAYANTTTDDLWKAVEESGARGLVAVAHDFTFKPGIPLVRVSSARCEAGSTRLTLTQGEFSMDRRAKTDASPLSWRIPVTAQLLGKDKQRTVISGGKVDLTLPGCGTLLVNAGQDGYYRTLYAADQLAALKAHFGELAAKDQYGLVTDALALSQAGYQPMAPALDLLDAVSPASSAKVQAELIGRWEALYGLINDDTVAQQKLASHVGDRFAPSLNRLGFMSKTDEPLLDNALRVQLISALGNMGDARVLAEGRRLFDALDRDPAAMDGPLRQSWLQIIARNADRATWDKLHKLAKSSDSALERSTLYQLLGRVRDKALAQAALDLALTDEPGKTDSAAIISAVAQGHPDLTTDFALAHLPQVEGLIDGSGRSGYIARLAGESRDPAMVAKLRDYAQKHLPAQSRTQIEQAINRLEMRQRLEPAVRAGVKDWLAH
jgi:aminopeptidase N